MRRMVGSYAPAVPDDGRRRRCVLAASEGDLLRGGGMILSAQSIRAICPVRPFHERTIAHGKTFGLSCAGYDIRIAETVWLFPGIGRLASAIERFDMPDDVLAQVCDKSSWARKHVAVQNTVIEPGWRGYLTVELTLARITPLRIPAGAPIAQIIFFRLDQPTDQPYSGRYQDQAAGPQRAIRA